MKRYFFSLTAALLLLLGFQSCLKAPELTGGNTPKLPAVALDYTLGEVPEHFGGEATREILNANRDNEVVTLGRVLFYDKRLSLNNTVSCASCHKQANAFADPNRFSVGFEGKVTSRNASTIVNPVFSRELFWDSRAAGTADLVLKPIENHIEMGMESYKMLEKKLANTTYYPELFEKAFGSKEIRLEAIQTALTAFVDAMLTMNSKYDEGVKTNFANFNPEEKMGLQIFRSQRAQCSSCHTEPNFSIAMNRSKSIGPIMFEDFSFVPPGGGGGGDNPYEFSSNTTNIGLDVVYADQGFGNGNFRIPSLRNIALTGPYMHDGRFNTLEEVVKHYNSNIQPHSHLDKKFVGGNGKPLSLGLSSSEEKALVAFLKTLTDDKLVKDKRFSDPFKL